jgi:hypothetical protein
MLTGERLLVVLIGGFGAVWAVQSGHLRYWDDFAPGSGFLPFWLGMTLVVLAGAVLVSSLRAERAQTGGAVEVGAPAASQQVRVILIAAGLFACIGLFDWLGFTVSVALYLVFLIGIVERRPLTEAVLVGGGVAASLWLIFLKWLHVPLPIGPWGF